MSFTALTEPDRLKKEAWFAPRIVGLQANEG